MITIKKIYLIGFFLLLNFSLFSQILGGRSNGEMSPKVAQPSTLSGGTFSGDVNNMTGAYQASIPLGSVATPGGLSFGLSLEHTSSFGFSTNQQTSSGIPYGDGWNLSLPSISVETDIFNAYINSCSNSGACNVAGIDNNDAVNSLNPDRIWDGDLFWFSPTVNIPGVGGGQAVFKYIDNSDGGCAVFVLNKFETPIEIRFYGMNWEAHLADGTVYSFAKSVKTYRAPSNKRTFYYDCTTPSETFDMDAAHSALVEEPADFLFGEAIRDEIEPKEDFGTWYCDRIYNRNLPMQNIIFTYETFGEFNYFKEFLQPNYSLVLIPAILTT